MPSGLGTPGLPRAQLEPHCFSARALLGVSDSARDSTIKTRTPRVQLVIQKNVTTLVNQHFQGPLGSGLGVSGVPTAGDAAQSQLAGCRLHFLPLRTDDADATLATCSIRSKPARCGGREAEGVSGTQGF